MSSPSNPIETVSETVEEKRDAMVELWMFRLCDAGVRLAAGEVESAKRCLRERIRTLVEEARKEERRYVLDQTSNFFGDDR